MIYVMSDIHGCLNAYKSMLAKIDLKDSDSLYILGNVIDYGEDSIELLKDMMMRANVFPLVGDHEVIALNMMKRSYEKRMNDAVMKKCRTWLEKGGMKTFSDFNALDDEEKLDIIDYLEEFTLFDEVTLKKSGKQFVLVHAGLKNFSADRNLEDYELKELLTQCPDYDKVYFDDKILVTGHKITPDNKVINKNNHLAINCGCAFGGALACVRLDDMKEFYVKA